MYERIKVKKLTPYIYLLNDMQEASGHLVVGKEKALVVDTMNGYEDVNAVVREITDLPIAEHFTNEPQFAANCRVHNLKMPEFAPIYPGEEIDLGGVLLEVLGLPGHTPGGICKAHPYMGGTKLIVYGEHALGKRQGDQDT